MILVTGFGPYREDINASGELVSSLKSDFPRELLPLKGQLALEVITCDDSSRETEHQTLVDQLVNLLKTHDPELCIYMGQAPPCNKITIEKIAINSFMREVIDPLRPVAYWSDLPGINDLPRVLEDRNIPAAHSYYAGQHLCNHILYSSLDIAEKNKRHHKSGFIHVPILPEQAQKEYRDAPFMPLEMSRMALTIAINHVFQSHRHNHVSNRTSGMLRTPSPD